MKSPPASDVTYHVTVSNVSGVPSSSYEYDVVVIDPATPTPVLPTTWGGLKTRYAPGDEKP